jgi:hypothetical protein
LQRICVLAPGDQAHSIGADLTLGLPQVRPRRRRHRGKG